MKNRCRKSFFFCLLWAGACTAQFSAASPEIVQVTTHPDADLAPRISPDGKWMAYVSKQIGNYDIWLRNLETGNVRRLTDHQADDYYPVWDKKNRYLIFVSQRSDAKGDLYRLNLRSVRGELIPKGQPERLTDYLGFDGYPTISEYDEHIAWVSDRTGRPEIWLMTKRAQAVRRLTYCGATHPAWSPKQSYLAFTSFAEEGSNGDIWLINLYAANELVERRTASDSLDRPMWPVTRGPAADGFPTWSPDARTILFCRSERDDNGDGMVTPSDRSTVSAVDVSHLPEEHEKRPNPSFVVYRDSFFERIAHSARPIVSEKFAAAQPEYGFDRRIYFVSEIKGNFDIYSFPDSLIRRPAKDFDPAAAFPLPNALYTKEVHRIVIDLDRNALTEEERNRLRDRVLAFHRRMDLPDNDDEAVAEALYEIAVTRYLLNEEDRCRRLLDFLLENYAQTTIAGFAELFRRALDLPAEASLQSKNDRLLQEAVSAAQQPRFGARFAAEALLLIGDLQERTGHNVEAEASYRKAANSVPQYADLSAEALLRLGRLQSRQERLRDAFQTFASILQNFPGQGDKVSAAREEILLLLSAGADDEESLEDRLRLVIGRFSTYDAFVVGAFLQLAELQAQRGDYAAALQTCGFITAHFSDFPAECHKARMLRAETLFKMGEAEQAVTAFSEAAENIRAHLPHLAAEAEHRMTEILNLAARELMSAQQLDAAAARFRRILEIDPRNLQAHHGYIECADRLGRLDQVILEYDQALKKSPKDNVLLYAQGLAYSYLGASFNVRECRTEVKDVKALMRSNELLQKALALDYNLIDAYLTLSFNNEQLEVVEQQRKAKPKSFLRKAAGTVTAPVVWLYRTLTFYEETKPPRYYEAAIRDLTRALALNDERTHPQMEALLARNRANAYYSFGEFGFRKAYEDYHYALGLDSTFAEPLQEALIYERMGHCAVYVNDQQRGPRYLKRAVELLQQMNDEERALLNIKRLALLYEVGENSRDALTYYLAAAEIERKRGRYDGLLRSLRSAALHEYRLGRYDEAIDFAEKALELLEKGWVPRKKSNPVYLQIGFFDLYLPVPYDLRKLGAKSTIDISTEEEEAFIYTILANVFSEQKEFDRAVEFYQKKFEIYGLRHDYDAQAVFQNNMGYLYFLKGDYDNAWRQFTNAYWWCVRTKYVYGRLLNLENAAQVVLAIAREDRPEKKANLEKYRNWITGKLAELLKETKDDEPYYAPIHARYRLLLADLTMATPPPAETLPTVARSMALLEAAARAESHLQEAKRLAQSYSLFPELCAAHFRRGEILARCGEPFHALPAYLRARELAEQHQLTQLLWQIDAALGTAARTLPSEETEKLLPQKDALFYLYEAVRLLEAEPVSMPGLSAGRIRGMVQKPYRCLIELLLERGDADAALELAERMREKTFFDLFGRERLRFRNEIHQALFARADSLGRLLTQKLQQAGRQNNEEVTDLRNRYAAMIQTVRRKAPELEPFLKPTPLSVLEVQSMLRQGEAVLYQLGLEKRQVFWLLTRNERQLFELEHAAFEEGLRRWLGSDSTAFSAAEQLRSLFGPERFEGLQSLTVIPDYPYLAFPWSALFIVCNLPAVRSVASGLSSYYWAVAQQRNNRSSSSPQEEPGQSEKADTAPVESEESLHLSGRFLPIEPYPLYSRFVSEDGQLIISPVELLNRPLGRLPVILDAENPQQLGGAELRVAWERAFLYSGAAAILVPTAFPPSPQFFESFYDHLQQLPLATAFEETQRHFAAQGLPPSQWAAFQLFGAAPVSGADEQFLRSNEFRRQADEAFRSGDWPFAVRLYARLLEENPSAPNDDMRLKLMSAAVNGGDWDTAIKLLHRQIAEESRRNRRAAAAELQAQLSVVYRQASAAASADEAMQEYRRLCRVYSLPFDDAAPFAAIAALYEMGGGYENAARLHLQAADRYGRLGLAKKRIESLLEASRIFAEELGYGAAALETAETALEAAAKGRFFELEVKSEWAAARACRLLQIGAEERRHLKNAVKRAEEHALSKLLAASRLLLADFDLRTGATEEAADGMAVSADVLPDFSWELDRLLILSRLYAAAGDSAQAFSYAHQAYLQAGLGESRTDQAKAHEELAALHFAYGRFAEALNLLEKASAADEGPTLSRRAVHRQLFAAHSALAAGRNAYAARLAEALLPLCTRTHLHDFVPRLWLLKSLAASAPDSALAFAEKAAVTAARRYDVLFLSRFRAAELLSKNNAEQAIARFAAALDALRNLDAGSFEVFDQPAETEKRFFGQYIRLLTDNGRIDEALTVADVHRNRTLSQHIRLRPLFSGQDQRLIERHTALSEKAARLHSHLMFKSRRSSLFAAADSQSVRRSLSAVLDSLALFRATIAKERPALAGLFFAQDRRVVEPLPENVLRLSYYYDDRTLYIWKRTTQSLELVTASFDADQLHQVLHSMQALRQVGHDAGDFHRLLYDQLLKPCRQELQQAETVILIPFEKLFAVPFALLVDENGDYFGLEKAFVVGTWSTALPLTKSVRRFAEDGVSAAFVNPEGSQKNPLYYAAARTLERYGRTFLFSESRATAERLRMTAPQTDLLFIGGEVRLNDREPLRSVVLSAGRDSTFTMGEFFTLSRVPALICFGACGGQVEACAGLIQAAAFLADYSGASYLMPHPFIGEPIPAAVLLKRFFRALAEGTEAPEALNTARRTVQSFYPHAQAWAFYTLIAGSR